MADQGTNEEPACVVCKGDALDDDLETIGTTVVCAYHRGCVCEQCGYVDDDENNFKWCDICGNRVALLCGKCMAICHCQSVECTCLTCLRDEPEPVPCPICGLDLRDPKWSFPQPVVWDGDEVCAHK